MMASRQATPGPMARTQCQLHMQPADTGASPDNPTTRFVPTCRRWRLNRQLKSWEKSSAGSVESRHREGHENRHYSAVLMSARLSFGPGRSPGAIRSSPVGRQGFALLPVPLPLSRRDGRIVDSLPQFGFLLFHEWRRHPASR